MLACFIPWNLVSKDHLLGQAGEKYTGDKAINTNDTTQHPEVTEDDV